jgi:DNA-binding NarL/FixJ family response regulator
MLFSPLALIGCLWDKTTVFPIHQTNSMDKINILLVDDEALIRQGLRALLDKENFIDKIFEASDALEFQNILSSQSIDIILLDIRLRDTTGLELLDSLKNFKQKPKTIAVTGMEGVELIINLLKAGVDGIVYKLDGYEEIRRTIKSILKSGNYFPEKILRIIQSNLTRWDHIPTVTLSVQELLILKALSRGSITKEIATELKMAEATAETYRVRLIKKVGVSNTAALLAYAYRNGIL